MATIRSRVRNGGRTTHTVMWRDPHTRKQRGLTFGLEQDAKVFCELLNVNGQDDSLVSHLLADRAGSGPTVNELLEIHIAERTRATVGTIAKYRQIARVHFAGSPLGVRRANKIQHADIIQWIQWMQEQSKSAKTISNAHGLLAAAFNTAIVHKIRPDNPCAHIELPRRAHADDVTTFLTRPEFDGLLTQVPSHYQLLTVFLVSTGARFSEAGALRWLDLDLAGTPATANIRRAWKADGKGGFYIGDPKSRRSKRIVSFHGELAAQLLEREGDPDDLVFVSASGRPLQHWTFHEQAWTPAVKAAQSAGLLKSPRPHDLRHTHASWMIQAGMNIMALSRRMGHESTTITTDLYGHLLPDALFEGAAAIERMMGAKAELA